MLRNLVGVIFTLVWGFVLVLVGARFLALLFDANRSSEIVERIYEERVQVRGYGSGRWGWKTAYGEGTAT